MAIRHKALISNINATTYSLDIVEGHFGQRRFIVQSPVATIQWDKYENDGEACMVTFVSPKTTENARLAVCFGMAINGGYHDVQLSTMKQVLDVLEKGEAGLPAKK